MPPLSKSRTGAPSSFYPDTLRGQRRQVQFEIPLLLHKALSAKAKELGISVSYMVLSELQPYLKKIEEEYGE